MSRKMSHDQNFKNLLIDYPQDALALFAPEEAVGIVPPVRIIPVRQEQLKSRLGDRFRELDVPLLVEWPDGQREALLFVLEEESNPGRFSIHRLAHYCLDLAEMFSLSRVVPVVIFLTAADNLPQALILGTERCVYLQFSYLRCVLAGLHSEDYWDSTNLVARLNLPNMQYSRAQKVDVYAQAINGLLMLEPSLDKQAKYIDFVDIYSALDDNEMQIYIDKYPQEAKAMSTLSERLREEGMQQGEVILLKRLLSRRFGTLDAVTVKRLESASTDDLELFAENLLDANSLEDVFIRH
ncbi:DUF4351 domain-containing protein [Nitrincola sp. MINF-07-Sa-05]|uniref:DUF4351 domain-containing protein n=1 Tax=Nitrincola salilacus TaxID=3400273 RepID=UPI003918619F